MVSSIDHRLIASDRDPMWTAGAIGRPDPPDVAPIAGRRSATRSVFGAPLPGNRTVSPGAAGLALQRRRDGVTRIPRASFTLLDQIQPPYLSESSLITR
jgi:hypothetical protein